MSTLGETKLQAHTHTGMGQVRLADRTGEQIVFIGEFRFPDGDAAAIRTMSLAKIFRDLGFRVTVIGKGQVNAADLRANGKEYALDGISYLTMNPKPLSLWQRLRHPVLRLRQFAIALESMDLRHCRAIVINASSSARHIPFVEVFCRQHSIPLVGDVCEWYDPRQMTGGWLNPYYWVFTLAFHWWIPRLRNLIVVSRLLESRFEGKGRNLTRIAAPIDLTQIVAADLAPKDRLVLLYAGVPGRKDLIHEILVALTSLTSAERSRIEFRFLGPTRQDLVNLCGGSVALLEQLADTIQVLGRVPRSQVIVALQEAHFSVLLRPNLRYANAGFPSKVVESLAAGTPLLLNLTSDLADYLGDGRAAISISGCSAEAVATAIRKALSMTSAEIQRLRISARQNAQMNFDYRLFLPQVSRFLERLR